MPIAAATSGFQVLLFGTAALVLYLCDLLRKREGEGSKGAIVVATGLVLVVAAVGWLFRLQLAAGIPVIAGGNHWIDSISQYRTAMEGLNVFQSFGLAILIMPGALILLRTIPLPWRRFLLIWTLTMAIATVARVRFAEYLPFSIAIMAGVAVFFVQTKNREAGWIPSGLIAPTVLVLMLQSPTWSFFATLKQSGGNLTIKGDIEETMLWLRNSGRPTRGAGSFIVTSGAAVPTARRASGCCIRPEWMLPAPAPSALPSSPAVAARRL